MEDLNMLAADCIVISCCCQCLVLQIVVLLLLKLPRKLIRKTREFAKRRLRQRERGQMVGRVVHYKDEFIGIDNGRGIRIQADGLSIESDLSCGCCMEEIEKVMEELHQKGEFAFGSFWGKDNSDFSPNFKDEEECNGRIVQYQLIEVINCT